MTIKTFVFALALGFLSTHPAHSAKGGLSPVVSIQYGNGSTPRLIATSPDGSLMATVSGGIDLSHIVLWDWIAKRQLRILKQGDVLISSVLFSNDGGTLFVGRKDGKLTTFATETGLEIGRAEMGNCPVSSIGIAGRGGDLAVACGEQILVVDPRSLAVKRSIQTNLKLSGVAITPSGEYVLGVGMLGFNAHARVYDVASGKLREGTDIGFQAEPSLLVDNKGAAVAICSNGYKNNDQLAVFDPDSFKLMSRREFPYRGGIVCSAATLANSGRELLFAFNTSNDVLSKKHEIRKVDIGSMREDRIIEVQKQPIGRLASVGDEVIFSQLSELLHVNVNHPDAVERIRVHNNRDLRTVNLNSRGHLTYISNGVEVELDLDKLSRVAVQKQIPQEARDVLFKDDRGPGMFVALGGVFLDFNDQYAVAAINGSVIFVDKQAKTSSSVQAHGTSMVKYLFKVPSGFGSLSLDGALLLWKFDGMGFRVDERKKLLEKASQFEVSPDGLHAIVGSWDKGVVTAWKTADWSKVFESRGHARGVFAGTDSVATYSGKYAFSVRLFSLVTGEQRLLFEAPKFIDSIAIDAQGKKMAVASHDENGSEVTERLLSGGEIVRRFKSPYLAESVGISYSTDGRKIVLKSNSEIKILDVDGARELASVFIFGDAALILTPEGYFSTNNPAAFQLLNFVNGSKAYPIDAFYDVFHRPDIVAAKLQGDDDYVKFASAGVSLDIALKNPPPVVKIDTVPAVVSEKQATISYSIAPGHGGVAEVRVFQNGKLIFSDGVYKDSIGKVNTPIGSGSRDTTLHVEAMRNATLADPGLAAGNSRADVVVMRKAEEKMCNPCLGRVNVDVVPGEVNVITVVAFNRDNTVQSVPASATFQSNLPKDEPNLWVLSVGIDQFESISSLKNARKDARDFVCTYVGKGIVGRGDATCMENGRSTTLFKPHNVHVVDVLLDAKATKSAILNALHKVAMQAKTGDTFVWFVASHGVIDAYGNFGLVAHDTQCLDQACTEIRGHLTSNEILDASKKIRAMKQLIVLDTCHSGGLDTKLSGLYDARVSLLAKNMGLHLFASAQSTEVAQDGIPGTNGVFTSQLLQGIRGSAPGNKDGLISVVTLGEYAKQKTMEITLPKSEYENVRPVQIPVIQHFGQDLGLAVSGR